MKKMQPSRIKDAFISALDDSSTLYRECFGSLDVRLQCALAELTILHAGVAWERFIADLFAAYVNRKSSALQRYLSAEASRKVTAELGSTAGSHVSLTLPNHLSMPQVYQLLDQEERNLSFPSAAKMVSHARNVLVTEHHRKFDGLGRRRLAVIDATRAMRNFVAHGSQESRNRMNKALKASRLPRSLRRTGERGVRNLGAYLNAKHSGKVRLGIYLEELEDFARCL